MRRAYFFVTCMNIVNWSSQLYHTTLQTLKNLYQHLTDYIYNRHITWVLPEGHSLPLPLSHINNQVPAKWTYSDNVLHCITSTQPKPYKLSWLSMKLVVDGKDTEEYDMDSFLNEFRVMTDDLHPPHLTHLFLAWCAETKHWFSRHSMLHFVIIDDQGQERVLSLKYDNQFLELRDGKVYDIVNQKDYYHEMVDPRTCYHG